MRALNFLKIKLSITSHLDYLALAICLACILKVALVIFSNPIYAYANNYDFIRQSSCTGLWQHYPNGKLKTDNNPERPVNSLIFDGDKSDLGCLYTIDNIYPYLATVFHTKGDKVDFREVSVWKFIFLFLSIALIFRNIIQPQIRLLFSTLVLFIFGDLTNILYFNTLYAEYTTILSVLAVISLLISVILSEKIPSKGMILSSLFFIFCLAMGKHQYSPLAFFFAILFSIAIYLRWQLRKIVLWFLAVGVFFPVFFSLKNSHMSSLNLAYNTDTFFWAVLPESQNRQEALRTLGLPSHCEELIGKSWYSPDVAQNHTCPEVAKTSRTKLVLLFASELRTFTAPIWKTMNVYHPSFPANIGYAEESGGTNSNLFVFARATSLTTIMQMMTPFTLALLLLSAIAIGLASTIPFSIFIFKPQIAPSSNFMKSAITCLCLGGFIVFYSIATTVFGDGYAEVPKHAMLTNLGLFVQLAGVLFYLIPSLKKIYAINS